MPWPQLHVHGVLVGGQRTDGAFVGLESAGLFRWKAPLEGGAVGRAVLANDLVDLGFEIETGTGRHARFFEVSGVPAAGMAAMSGRAQDVAREVELVESRRGKRLRTRERAVVAMKTRAPKRNDLSVGEIVAVWNAVAEAHGMSATEIAQLRKPGVHRVSLDARREAVRAAIEQRVGADVGGSTPAELRAIAFESAAGRLLPSEAHALIESATVSDGPHVTTPQIEALETQPGWSRLDARR